MSETWRQRSIKVIQELLTENPEAQTNEKLFVKLTREAYPFHERKYFPYQAWLKAVRDTRQQLFHPVTKETAIRAVNPDQLVLPF